MRLLKKNNKFERFMIEILGPFAWGKGVFLGFILNVRTDFFTNPLGK